MKQANAGDQAAEYDLGMAYYDGKATLSSKEADEKAIYWLTKSAKQGTWSKGEYRGNKILGFFYYKKGNYKKAAYYLLNYFKNKHVIRAANAYAYGKLYINSFKDFPYIFNVNINNKPKFLRIKKNYAKAFYYYTKSSNLAGIEYLSNEGYTPAVSKIEAIKKQEAIAMKKRQEAIFLSGLSKTERIIYKYIKAHNISFNCNEHTVNDYVTQQCGSFTVNGDTSTNNYIISQSLFSTQLQHSLAFSLRNSGFGNYANVDLTTAFVNYINGHLEANDNIGDGRLLTIAALSDMVGSGHLKPFNELVNLFVRHFERINK
ncbi:MAG: SEL1-like repeat protein [bacterium]